MIKRILWMGAIILLVGIILFSYSYSIIQNIKASAGSIPLDSYLFIYPEIKQQWDLASLLQPIGLGMMVLGLIMIAYSVLKKT